MMYPFNFLDIIENINPRSFSEYLENAGWELRPTKNELVKAYQITTNGDSFQVNIPMDRALFDYKMAMHQAITTVALVEFYGNYCNWRER